MDFADRIRELSAQAPGRIAHVETEEATKNALVLPFIQCLGYDIFNPNEVVPEFNADVADRKGEKVDYAIFKDGTPIVFIECKPARGELDVAHAAQLTRYFHCVTEVKFAILTNGVRYNFFSDLDNENLMDRKPFLEVNLLDLSDGAIEELKKFTKPLFDKDRIHNAAGELRYTKELRLLIESEFANPSEDFMRYLVSKVHSGRVTQNVIERFRPMVRKSLSQYLNHQITATLDRARALQDASTGPAEPDPGGQAPEAADAEPTVADAIETTADELQAFYIIRAILASRVSLKRIVMRDVQSYCGILLDDNNRKPICRLHFNNPRRLYIGLFDANKQEERVPIEAVEDIFAHAEHLHTTVAAYDAETNVAP